LADAIERLAHSTTKSSNSGRIKVCEPDTFDGSDPKKLRPFIVQCELNFQSRPDHFRRDRPRVTFAQSYLK
ncbi:hypothetical protein BJ138DRAFT_966923, partial [Hygrophoropsis aurantiaca]